MKKYFISFFFFTVICNAQWQPDYRLTTDPASSFLSYNNTHCIAVYADNLHVVWWDGRDLDREIYYNRSTDNGLTWQTDTRLTNSVGWSEYPSIAVYGSNIHIVWMDDRDLSFYPEIYYKHSTDGGINWSADVKLTSNPSDPAIPSLAVFGNNIHVVWHDLRDGNWEIYYKRSTDNGITWQSDVRLTIDGSVSERASIAVCDSSVYVVWQDERDNDKEIYFKFSTDNGTKWSGDNRLTNIIGESETPTLAVDNSNINVIWSDSRNGVGNSEIYLKNSVDGGINWSDDKRITNTSIASNKPSIAVSSNLIHISWNEVWEIYYMRSTDYGTTWEAETRITNNSSHSENSFVVVSDSVVNLIWQDNPANNDDIYYKRNPTGNIITDVITVSNNVPTDFKLEQNYPNPFNPTTKIKYQVSPPKGAGSISHIVLKVYDVLGKEVAVLVNEEQQAGKYEVEFQSAVGGRQLASGIYFYQLRAGDYTAVKKMILLK